MSSCRGISGSWVCRCATMAFGCLQDVWNDFIDQVLTLSVEMDTRVSLRSAFLFIQCEKMLWCDTIDENVGRFDGLWTSASSQLVGSDAFVPVLLPDCLCERREMLGESTLPQTTKRKQQKLIERDCMDRITHAKRDSSIRCVWVRHMTRRDWACSESAEDALVVAHACLPTCLSGSPRQAGRVYADFYGSSCNGLQAIDPLR